MPRLIRKSVTIECAGQNKYRESLGGVSLCLPEPEINFENSHIANFEATLSLNFSTDLYILKYSRIDSDKKVTQIE